jgi:single-strand DNA-binding protein
MKNKELFMGRLGVDPYLQYTQSQKAICELSVAVKHREGHTLWKKVIVWGKQAEQCSLYLKKGYRVFIDGVREINQYTNKKGEIKQYEQIKASLVGFVSL